MNSTAWGRQIELNALFSWNKKARILKTKGKDNYSDSLVLSKQAKLTLTLCAFPMSAHVDVRLFINYFCLIQNVES